MKIDLAGDQVEAANGLREYVAHKMRAATARFRDRIHYARVKVANVHTRAGEADKRCVVQVRLKNLPDVVFAITKLEAHAAVDAAAERLARVLAQRLKRARPPNQRAVSALPA